MINVTCGIIRINNKYLISQRSKYKKEYPLFWELPGGKSNENESIKECLIRELKEELNIDVEFKEVIHIKMNFLDKYNLYYCSCNCITNEKDIKPNYEIEKFSIVDECDLLNYNFIHGDKDILKKYLDNKK
jgi:8-oxo-dGTP diphosphatase